MGWRGGLSRRFRPARLPNSLKAVQKLSEPGIEPGVAVRPQVHRLLRQRIIQNDLEPGARVSETEIAARYGVSRQPVREAFIKLAEEGLVEVRPQRGTFVCKIAISSVVGAQFVRSAIETEIVARLAAQPDPGLIRTLRKLLAEQMAVSEGGQGFVELDDLFHQTLAEAAKQAYAWGVVEEIKSQMNRARYLTTSQFPVRPLVEQHTAIVDAIEQGDVAAAQRTMKRHLSEILKDLPEITKGRPEYFID